MGEFAVFIDDVFAEIPAGHLLIPTIQTLGGQPLVERSLLVAHHVYFLEQGEGDAIIFLAKRSDFLTTARLLTTKIIGRKTQHHHVGLVGLVEFLPVGILRRIPTFRRRVQDDYFLAFVLTQGHGLAVEGVHGEIIQRFRGGVVQRSGCRQGRVFVAEDVFNQAGE